MWRNKKNNYRKNIVIPLVEYNFFDDYDEKFFKTEYPLMWKNVSLHTEWLYWAEIENKVRKEQEDSIFRLIEKHWPNLSFDFATTFKDFMEHRIKSMKLEKAQEIMNKALKELKKIEFDEDSYILTKTEIKEKEEELKRRARELYNIRINKNGINAKIDQKEDKTYFKYKWWEEYVINTMMKPLYRRETTDREEEILRNCDEAWLHYKTIAKIFGINERNMATICKKLWLENVFATPQKLISKLTESRVLDKDWMFLITKRRKQK